MSPAARRAAARSAAEGALAAILATAAAAAVWRGAGELRAVAAGVGIAWVVSSASTAGLIWAQEASPRAFWWTFGGGMALRLATLAGLMLYSVTSSRLPQAALLVAYALGVLFLLLVEYRHVKAKPVKASGK